VALIALGVDSGGTHTTCAVDNGEGSDKGTASESAHTISDTRGPRVMRAAADWIVDRVISASTPGDDVCVWIGASVGLSAASFESLEDAFGGSIRRLTNSGRECEIFIANDAVSILKSPPLLGRGVAAIVGTGSIVLGAHPACRDGIIRRGGYEWPVGDVGAGVWMTFESIRLVLEEIQSQGSEQFSSPLLDRLCDYFGVSSSSTDRVPESHLALARAEILAAVVSQGGEDKKRKIAGFVHPHLFDLARIESGLPHDPIAAKVIARSVRFIVEDIVAVSETLAAFTADTPNARERLPLVVAGNIAANPIYQQQLTAAISECKYVEPMQVIGDAAPAFARLALHYLRSDSREKKAIARSFDPMHEVHRLL
jgi:N-acetylglucosamine kinase-like BadF-type ATPase